MVFGVVLLAGAVAGTAWRWGPEVATATLLWGAAALMALPLLDALAGLMLAFARGGDRGQAGWRLLTQLGLSGLLVGLAALAYLAQRAPRQAALDAGAASAVPTMPLSLVWSGETAFLPFSLAVTLLATAGVGALAWLIGALMHRPER